jgi:hypothetical protein
MSPEASPASSSSVVLRGTPYVKVRLENADLTLAALSQHVSRTDWNSFWMELQPILEQVVEALIAESTVQGECDHAFQEDWSAQFT